MAYRKQMLEIGTTQTQKTTRQYWKLCGNLLGYFLERKNKPSSHNFYTKHKTLTSNLMKKAYKLRDVSIFSPLNKMSADEAHMDAKTDS